jgi:hypothetical protein
MISPDAAWLEYVAVAIASRVGARYATADTISSQRGVEYV